MGSCNLDHSREDVIKKLYSQETFLRQDFFQQLADYLRIEKPQDELNELFHLLKKFDLATEEEQDVRLVKMKKLIG
ncbi:hypothetical protein [Alkalihalobacillus pseudalcaliphilus]|uniref:hypothetical protein n=1 Tax=Alkalihalobacillus pseudalcaliphilus TaxID=79884 RepID=UPI00064DE581|nr:hypothetical protein [Alkalihalobacillus pseudalcaliphilus]KMK76856.1 group-specific protein [Alkalihalobacillus pseudalcaliphilus]